MQKYVGSDVTSMVTLPVLIFEPMSMLQKMAEVCAICFWMNLFAMWISYVQNFNFYDFFS